MRSTSPSRSSSASAGCSWHAAPRSASASSSSLSPATPPVMCRASSSARRYFEPLSLARLAARYTAAARRLARRWRALSGPPPLVVVGFGGQLDALLARRLCRPRAALVFAPLVTLSETLVEDRQVFPAAG